MTGAKPLASLSPSLLARKGAARPAMRPQLPMSFEEQQRVMFGTGQGDGFAAQGPAVTEDDLGWNDMGEEFDAEPFEAEPVQPVVKPVAMQLVKRAAKQLAPEKPAVVQQIESLVGAIEAAAPLPFERTGKLAVGGRSALKEGRKAAFTLRLDAYRHLRLRLACTLESSSAQQVVTEALDRFLADLPGLEEIARHAQRT